MPPIFDATGTRKVRDHPPVQAAHLTRPREHDIRRFEALHRFGPLNKSVLHVLTDDLVADIDATGSRLTNLASNSRTAYDKETYTEPFLFRPAGRTLSKRWKINEEIYDLTNAGKDVLKREELWQEHAPKRTNSFLHNYVNAFTNASVYLAARRQPAKYHYYFHDEVRASMKIDGDSFKIPAYDDTGARLYDDEDKEVFWDLEPDPGFLIEHYYCGKTIIHPKETDIGTEQNSLTERAQSNKDKKIWEFKLKKWIAFFDHRVYEQVYGKGASVMPIFEFTKEGKMRNVMRILSDLTDGKGHNNILFRHIPRFRTTRTRQEFETPKPMYTLFYQPYERVGKTPFNISQI